ncbi:MAG TPA: THUMP domain-containing protein [Thermoplasmata archaeon]|nr:THUMP domain-containing protein [Thermoplasmata archaeon]
MGGVLLVRYGELALKSPPVRREFETALRRNIVQQFVAEGMELRLRSDRGHLYAEVADAERGAQVLRRVFGVTSVSVVHEVPTERDALRTKLLELASPRLGPGASFAVRARRTGSHPFTSQELARDLGSDVLDGFPDRRLRVDLTRPDVELFVEVRGPRTYLYFDRLSGPGGLPLGVAGRLAALVDGERGALGAYLMMKRGCRVALAVPPTGVRFVRGVLQRFDPAVRVTELGPEPPSWSGVLRSIAEAVHADGVVLPLTVEEYPGARATWGETVVFSPTVGFLDAEVSSRWGKVVELAS